MFKKNKNLDFLLLSIRPFIKLIFLQNIIFILISLTDYRWRPYLLRNVINEVYKLSPGSDFSIIASHVTWYIVLSLLTAIFYRSSEYIWLKLNPTLKCHVGSKLIERIMKHSASFLGKNFSGSLGNKVKDAMSALPDLLRLIGLIISGIFSIVCSVITIHSINYKFSVLLIVWVFIFLAGSFFLLKRAKKISRDSAVVRSSVVGHMVDVFTNIINVQLFTRESREKELIEKKFDKWIKIDQKRDWYFIKALSFQGISFVLYQGYGFVLLLNGIKAGTVTAGDFALLTSVNVSILRLLWFISEDIMKIADMKGLLDQGLDIALNPVCVEEKKDPLELKVERGTIEFNNVSFKYESMLSMFFKNISITIKSKEKLGLVGYSGGGKSTFVNLILRMYDVQEGSIKICDTDVRDVTKKSLRENISVIAQETILFNRSILDNIKYGNPLATEAQIIEASRLAQAHDFILELDEGYNTIVEERGARLSIGQRQRIAIARALLKDAPIVIMDEATSQLDSITEDSIQSVLPLITKNKTTIIIAHRLSTLRFMDRILVFDKGLIVEDGCHIELLNNKDGLYYKMWNTQVNGFLFDKNN